MESLFITDSKKKKKIVTFDYFIFIGPLIKMKKLLQNK